MDRCLALVAESTTRPRRTAADSQLRRRCAGGLDQRCGRPVEYACHVRDVLLTFAVRIHRGVREDRPVLDPMYADWRAERFGYAATRLDVLLVELSSAAQGFADEVRAVPDDAWDRTVVRRPEEERTVRWLVRQAAHECVHHLRRRSVAGLSGEPLVRLHRLPVSRSVLSAEITPVQPSPATEAAVPGEPSSRSWMVVSRQVPSSDGVISQVTRLSGSPSSSGS